MDQTTSERTRIEEIIWCEGQASQVIVDAARDSDQLRWTAARLIAEELTTGKTQRQVAEEIGKSVTHVNFMNQVWRVYLGKQERSFHSCYQEVKRRPREDRNAEIRELSDQGMSGRAIAGKLGVDESTVRGVLKGSSPPAGEDRDTSCTPVNAFPGALERYNEWSKILLDTRQIKESFSNFKKAESAINRTNKALSKIRKDYHNG